MDEPLKEYKNHKGENIVIKEIENPALVKTYKFFLAYSKILRNIHVGVPQDNLYTDYVTHVVRIRDSLKYEIQTRKLKINSF